MSNVASKIVDRSGQNLVDMRANILLHVDRILSALVDVVGMRFERACLDMSH